MALDAIHTLSASSQSSIARGTAVAPIPRLLPEVELCIICRSAIQGTASPLLCTNCVKILESSNELSGVIAQCCECGALLNGIRKGEKPLLPSGAPDLSAGNSHGICASCAVAKLSAHRAAGRQRRTARLT